MKAQLPPPPPQKKEEKKREIDIDISIRVLHVDILHQQRMGKKEGVRGEEGGGGGGGGEVSPPGNPPRKIITSIATLHHRV